MEFVLVALISAVIGPVILSWLTGRQRKTERMEDWARQDQVAQQAKKASNELIKLNTLNGEQANINAKETKSQLDSVALQASQIHTLVNSNLTAQIQAELDATTTSLSLMQESIL